MQNIIKFALFKPTTNMNIKIIILLLIPFVAKSQFKIENLSQARSGIAYDFIGDTIMFVGGADTDVVDFYNITNGVKPSRNIQTQMHLAAHQQHQVKILIIL